MSSLNHSRQRSYGGPNNRDPLLDTGIPGVIVSRAVKKGHKRVVVSAAFQIKQTVGTPESVMRYVGSLFDGALADSPDEAGRRFSGFLRKAMAIRRYADTFYARDAYPTLRLHFDDVPQSIVDATPEPPAMDLRAIMDSFDPPACTPGEPERDLDALVLALQDYSLDRRRPAVTLNGHRLTFNSLVAQGVKVYVPAQMGRGRDHWWLTVDTEGGPWCRLDWNWSSRGTQSTLFISRYESWNLGNKHWSGSSARFQGLKMKDLATCWVPLTVVAG